MPKDIKQRIVLDGEKQYSQALKDAQRNLRTLRSELKAESAELGKNASEQDKNRVKTENLKKQIAEQEKIVQTLQAALAEVREKYADNADEVAKWEIKVNNARAALANMQNQLQGTNSAVAQSGDAMKQAAGAAEAGVTATKSFADSIGNLASVGDSVSGAIEGIFGKMLDSVRGAIGELWGEITELASRSNDWEDLAATWGTTTENIQAWYHAVRANHNDFAKMNQAVARIAVADPKKLAEYAMVSAENYTDQWQLAAAVMDSLAGMEHNQRLAATAEIFGDRRVEGISDLLNDWEAIRGAWRDFNPEEGGIGMTEEQMSTMSELATKVDHIAETWDAFKDSFMAGAFGKLSLDLAGSAQGMLNALIDFMYAESPAEREKAIQDLEQNITDFFTRLGEAIGAAAEALGKVGEDLQGSDNSYVKLIGDALKGLSDVLNWFLEEGNIEKVIGALETLAGFWIAGKGLSMAGKIAEVVANIKTITAFNALTGAGGAGGAATGGGGGLISTLTTSLSGALASITMGVTVAGFAAAAIGALGYIVKGDFQKDLDRGADYREQTREVNKALGRGETDVQTAWWTITHPQEATGGSSGADLLARWRATETPEAKAQREADAAARAQTQADEARRADLTGSGIVLPTIRTPKGRETGFDLTDEQRTAAENYWDLWKLISDDGSDETEAAFDAAFARLEELFAGQEQIYDMLMQDFDALKDENGDKWTEIQDLPASWFKNLWKQDNQVTSSDLAGFRSLPESIRAAVMAGASAGVSGIQVTIDGYYAGRVLAPYISAEIGQTVLGR